MKIGVNNIKTNDVLIYNDNLYVVIKDPEHIKPGKGPAYVQLEMKNIKNNKKNSIRLNSDDTIKKAFLRQVKMQFLYFESKDIMLFMDCETYEQISINAEIFDKNLPLITENIIVEFEFFDAIIVRVSLPSTVVVTIADTIPHLKGSTATASYKPATLTNGITIMVPPYLTNNDDIIIKTTDLSFVSRVK